MKKLKIAKKILYKLKDNKYEGYVVGGAVRDYLLKMEINDVDITTNATPYQIMKIFKGKPTGLKYGTVTVNFDDIDFEITTYRTENNYNDLRHPSEVVYAETVIEDVTRRDFTINGLLMDVHNKVIDYVNGMDDLNNKIIRTIGEPDERFNEDALRILRAIYFQSKLGFEIEKGTLYSMKRLRSNIEKLSKERVLTELIKALKGTHLKRAVETLIKTKIHEVLPGLKEGILYIDTIDDMPFIDAFFVLCFALNKGVDEYWPFSNKHRHKYKIASQLVNNNNGFNNKELYQNGLEICILANKVEFILKRDKNKKSSLEDRFNKLPIKSELDLKFRANDILALTNKKRGSWIQKLIDEMVMLVLDEKIENEFEDLKKYVLRRLEE